jgi:hypothetical protein
LKTGAVDEFQLEGEWPALGIHHNVSRLSYALKRASDHSLPLHRLLELDAD